MATAMVRCLRHAYPFARIDMVVREDFLDLIKANPHLDLKIGLPRSSGLKGLLELQKRINRDRYDLVYDAHRSLRTRLLMPFLNSPYKCFYQKQYLRRALALTFKLKWLLNRQRMLERYVLPLRFFGVAYDGGGPELFIDEKAKRAAEEKVPLPKLPVGVVRLGIIPSAQWPGKRWPLQNFRQLLEKVVKETSHQVVVFGGKEDDFCGDLCRGLPTDRIHNAQGKLNIAETTPLLKACDLVVANDTGLMHMADALGVPSVLMLGPTSAEMGCFPFHPESRILEHELWCRPCSKNGEAPCIRGKRLCLLRTTPDMVFAASESLSRKLLEQRPA